jgi:hypothetical protein
MRLGRKCVEGLWKVGRGWAGCGQRVGRGLEEG